MDQYLSPYSNLIFLTILLVVTAFSSSCNIIDSNSDSHIDFRNQMRISIEISDKEVEPGENFTATYSIRNLTGQPIYMTTTPPRFANAIVRKGGEIVEMVGKGSGGPGISGYHYLGVGKTLHGEFEVEARTRRLDLETQTIIYTPVEAGEYVLEISFNVWIINEETIRLPELERTFWVK